MQVPALRVGGGASGSRWRAWVITGALGRRGGWARRGAGTSIAGSALVPPSGGAMVCDDAAPSNPHSSREAKLKTTQLRFREATIVPNLIAPRRPFVLVKNRGRRSRPRIFPSFLVWHSTGPLITSSVGGNARWAPSPSFNRPAGACQLGYYRTNSQSGMRLETSGGNNRSALPLPLAGEGWGGGTASEVDVVWQAVFPHPPRSIERVDLPRRRER